MSHLLDQWLAASRAGNATLAAGIADASVSRYASPNLKQLEEKTVTVLEAVKKPRPIVVRPPTLAPPSIIPPGIMYPTARLVGHEQNGGAGIPDTIGPRSIANEEWPIGSLMFYIGKRVAVSIGIYDAGASFRDLLVSYHQRGARLRVHTGIGRMADVGVSGRETGPGGVGSSGVDEQRALVPAGRPEPPAGGYSGDVERWQEIDRGSVGQTDPWVPIVPGLPFNRPTLKQLEDTLKYFAGIADLLGIVL